LLITERRREKEEREKRRRKRRERRKGEEAPANSPLEWPEPSAARAYELCSFAKRFTRARIVLIFFARFSHVGGAFLFSSLLASAAKCMEKAVSQQEDGRIHIF
jgi:hypothetical protein